MKEKRIIKFRAKSLREKTCWKYGDLEYNMKRGIARIHSYNSEGNYEGQEKVDVNTIGQFTGLHDRVKNEIYEGDIISVGSNQCIVEYYDCEYRGVWLDYYGRDDADCHTIPLSESSQRFYRLKGNIYDNKDLLQQNN